MGPDAIDLQVFQIAFDSNEELTNRILKRRDTAGEETLIKKWIRNFFHKPSRVVYDLSVQTCEN